MGVALSEEEKTVFVRKASGLTRVISKWDALAYSFVAPTIAYAAIYIIWSQTFNPGANLYVAALWILSLLPIAGLYVLFSVSMPRSGGEYIYVSRIISPAWGLFSCWTLTIVGLNWSGVLTSWLVNWGIGDTVLAQGLLAGDTVGSGGAVDIGLYLNNPNTMEAFIIGTLALLLCYVIMARGTRAVVKFTWFIFIWNFIGLMVYAIALVPADTTVVHSRILAITTHSYSDIISGANAAAAAIGETFPAGNTYLLPTLMAGATYLNLSTLGSTFSANIAGEIKEVKSAQTIAQLGSLIMFVFYWEIFIAIQYAGFGVEWYQAIAMLDAADAAGAAAPGATSWMGFYFGYDVAYKLPIATYNVIFTTANPVLVGLSTLHFLIIDFGGMLTLAFGPVRNLFAWSFDGILPKFTTKVNRRGSPIGEVALGGMIA
ncbi:MAG: amino acid permease, partial [Candidatus Odinarchaeia archaeon]